MHGFWLVDFNEAACLPLWGDFVDKVRIRITNKGLDSLADNFFLVQQGCTAEGSGLHVCRIRQAQSS